MAALTATASSGRSRRSGDYLALSARGGWRNIDISLPIGSTRRLLAVGRLLSRNSTTKLWKWNKLHVEGCGLLSCPTLLLLSVFGFVTLDSLIHILLTELEQLLRRNRSHRQWGITDAA